MPSLIIFLPAVDPIFDAAGNIVRGSFAALVLFLLMINVLLNLPVDILSSWAVFQMGRGLCFRSAWLAWIPGGNLWVMGCIADEYQLRRGRKGCLRFILPLQAVWAVLLWYCTSTQTLDAKELIALADRFLLVPVLLSVGGIVAVYVALYRVFRYANLQSAAALTAISVIFSLPTPFFLWKAAKNF